MLFLLAACGAMAPAQAVHEPGRPSLALPVHMMANVVRSTRAIETSEDGEDINKDRITKEWDYCRKSRCTYIACTGGAYATAAPQALHKMLGEQADMTYFFAGADLDTVCWLVYIDPAEAEKLQELTSLNYIEPYPASSKLVEDLISYSVKTNKMKLNSAVFYKATDLSIDIFPKRLASEELATKLMAGLSIMLNHTALDDENCNSAADSKFHLCNKFFMEYSDSLNQTLYSAHACGFEDLNIRLGPDGVFLVDIKSISKEYDACGLSLLLYFASQPEVLFIDSLQPINPTSNKAASWVVQSGEPDSNPMYDIGVTGKGQVVGISDTGVDEESCFFSDVSEVANSFVGGPYIVDENKRKVVMYIAYEDQDDCRDGHGSHCAGSIAGFSTTGDTQGTGVAKDAKLAVMDISDSCRGLKLPNDLISGFLQPMHDNAGARIHSASWGSETSAYTNGARQFDKFIYDNPEHLVFIAAGNSGSNGLSSVGSPATLKNGIAVGASCSPNTDLDASVFFSSLGPTRDGRLKPDIMAPGVRILSAGGHFEGSKSCRMVYKSGTSMATPISAGAAALLRQFLMEGKLPGYNAFTPSAALVKAVMINSAENVKYRYSNNDCSGRVFDISGGDTLAPNDYQGFGRLELQNVLPIGYKSGHFDTFVFDNTKIASNQRHSYTFTTYSPPVGVETKDLRVSLVWTDPPPSSASSRVLVHDLDLTLIDQQGVVTYSNGRASADRLNNVERIFVKANKITPGVEYTIMVSANTLVATSEQDYSLVVTGNLRGSRGPLGVEKSSEDSRNSSDDKNDPRALIVIVFSSIFGVVGLTLIGFFMHKSRIQREDERGQFSAL
ncbi:hypothetical protein AAMO2058_001228800 [Amorphochlora amoebiformis]